VVEVKASKSNEGLEFESEIEKWRQIIEMEPNTIVSTTKIHPTEPFELEEGEHLFHSQMWVKGTPLHFLVDRGIHKNLILAEVFKWLALPIIFHLHPCTIGWLCQGRDLRVNQNFACPTTSSPSKMRYCVMFLPLNFVMFFWANLIYGNIMLYMSLGLTVLLLL
jgi:hypothetical protein